jgi:phage virion morphogenesis protein
MTGVAISTSFILEGFDEAIAKLMRLEAFDGRQLMDDVASLLESSTRNRFQTKVSPEGDVWSDWSPAYAASRGPNHSLLVADSKTREDPLYGSIDRFWSDDEAMVGSNLPYAAIHQFGGEDVGSGIPARPYLGLDEVDRGDINDIVSRTLEELLSNA